MAGMAQTPVISKSLAIRKLATPAIRYALATQAIIADMKTNGFFNHFAGPDSFSAPPVDDIALGYHARKDESLAYL